MMGGDRRYQPKHVERFTDINKLYIVASCWTIIGICFTMHGPLNVKYMWSLQPRKTCRARHMLVTALLPQVLGGYRHFSTYEGYDEQNNIIWKYHYVITVEVCKPAALCNTDNSFHRIISRLTGELSGLQS